MNVDPALVAKVRSDRIAQGKSPDLSEAQRLELARVLINLPQN